jgi:hypothetical protein
LIPFRKHETTTTNNRGTEMIEVENKEGYEIRCPVCDKRIQSENADGDWEGGFEPCEHLYIAYLCDSGMYYPHYKDKEGVAIIDADLEKLKGKVALDIQKEEGLDIPIEECREEVSEENSVVYLANNLPENMVSYCVPIQTGGCGGGHWTVDNLFIFDKEAIKGRDKIWLDKYNEDMAKYEADRKKRKEELGV